jgi:thiol-disulfide isomerase/thioredoxin
MSVSGRSRILAAVLAACTLAAWQARAAGGVLNAWTGGAAPALQLGTLEGKQDDLVNYRGKVVVLNFWATWCEPCREEMPSLQELRGRFAGRPLEVLTVEVGSGEGRIRQFLHETPVKLPILRDPEGEAMKRWKTKVLPTTYVLDPAGEIRYWFVGVLDWSQEKVAAEIGSLLPKK